MAIYRAWQELATFPGVSGVSLGIPSPFGTSYSMEVWLPVATGAAAQDGRALLQRSHRGLLRHHGHRVATGQGLHQRDRAAAPGHDRQPDHGEDVLARQGGHRSVHHARLGFGAALCEVVGIVEDARRMQLREEPMLQYYVPVDQTGASGMSSDRTLFIRVAGDPEWHDSSHCCLMSLDANLPVAAVRSMDTILQPGFSPYDWAQPFGRSLACWHCWSRRWGSSVWSPTRWRPAPTSLVRGALGADRGRSVGLVLREALIITAIGLAVGAAGALALGRWAAPMLFDTSPRDPLVIGGVAIVMLVTAVERARAGPPRIPD